MKQKFESDSLNIKLSDKDNSNINDFIEDSENDYIDPKTDKYKSTELFRGILSTANMSLSKVRAANQKEIDKLKPELSETQLLLSKANELNKKLQSDYELLESQYKLKLQDTEISGALADELNHKISDLQTENKRLESVWTNAQKEIQRLTNEIKDNELAPNEFIISLSKFQRACIFHEMRENKDFAKKINEISRRTPNFHIRPITNDDMIDTANFLWSYYIFTKEHYNGIIDSKQLREAFTKYTK